MIWPKYADYADYADYAENAEYADYADFPWKTFHGNLNQDLLVCHCKIVIGKFVEISAFVHSFGIKLAKESSYQ